MIKLNGGYVVSLTMLSSIMAAVSACSGGGDAADENEALGNTAEAVVTTDAGASDPGPRSGAAGAGAPLAAQPIAPDDPGQQAIAAAACFPACAAGTTGPQPCLSNPDVLAFCKQAVIRFQEVDSVSGSTVSTGIPGFIDAGVVETGTGVGPTFNNVGCHVCHSQPGVLGAGVGPTSPQFPKQSNPQVAIAKLDGATNTVPSFITASGPIREARFKSDSGVHDLYTIAGRKDATGCSATQPDFTDALTANNVSFRIPIATFGDGLVELIPEMALEANLAATSCGSPTLAATAIATSAGASTTTTTTTGTTAGAAAGNGTVTGGAVAAPVLTVSTALPSKATLGISGTFNRSGNDGTITRFGWKAQNKSLLIFAGEAYNVEQGVTNLLFPNEREGGAGSLTGCMSFNGVPEDQINFAGTLLSGANGGTGSGTVSDDHADILNFSEAMVLSRPATAALPPGVTLSQVFTGLSEFTNIGCAHCHTPSFTTATSAVDPGLSGVSFSPFSDFAIHTMGTGLSDGVTQGNAGPQQFRTAPLWGVGQRLFFLHDGRASDLVTAIEAHSSSGSEAVTVINSFNALSETNQQDIIYFLRSL